jgi:hypothetical protein
MILKRLGVLKIMRVILGEYNWCVYILVNNIELRLRDIVTCLIQN